jgi:hypothetical protein
MTQPTSRPTPVIIFLLVAGWIITLILAHESGFRSGVKAESKSRDAAQVEQKTQAEIQTRALVDLAYPPDRRPVMVISVPPAAVAEQVEKSKAAPEVVRAILYEEVTREHTEFCTTMGTSLRGATSKQFWEGAGKDASEEYLRRIVALRDWKPKESSMMKGARP